MSINKALLALALGLALAAVTNQPPAQAQDMMAMNNANNLITTTVASMDDARRPPPRKPVAAPKTIVVPAGTRVIYQTAAKKPNLTYLNFTAGTRRMLRVVDYDLQMVCYTDMGSVDNLLSESAPHRFDCNPIPEKRAR